MGLIIILRILAFSSLLFHSVDALNEKYEVVVKTKQCVFKTDQKFMSVALDSGLIHYRWDNFDFRSAKLRTFAKGLAPAYLRIG